MSSFCVIFLLLLLKILVAADMKLQGLPFNLPETKFCTPCERDPSRFYYPTLHHDELCLRYAIDVGARIANVGKLSLYNDAYDISVLAIPTVDDTTCIKLVKAGIGFLRGLPQKNVNKPNPHLNQTLKKFDTGRMWESTFLNGMEDIWTSAYFSSLQRRVAKIQESSTWELKAEQTSRTLLSPTVNPAFFRQCGDNDTIPEAIADDVARCKGQMECQLNPRQTDHTYPRIPIQQGTSNYQSNVASSSGDSSVQKTSKRQKLEEPTMVINEFNPSKLSPHNLEEFIEIRASPAPQNQQQYFKTVKIIAIGAYSQRLLLIINLNKILIPSNGHYAIRSSLASRSFVHTTTDQQQFKLLPGYESEPIALLLLKIDTSVTASDWDRIKVFSRDLTPASESKTWDVIRKTIIDVQFYGHVLNQDIPQQLRSVLPTSFSHCNFIILTGDVEVEFEMTSSFKLCNPSHEVKPFQYQFFKLGTFMIGFPNDCDPNVMNQVERAEHREQHIQRKYKPNYQTNLFPTEVFKDTTWLEIYNEEFIDLQAVSSLHPFELVDNEDFDPNVGGESSRKKYFRYKICHQRIHDCPGTFTHNQKRSQIIEKEPIPTSFPILRQKIFKHLDSLEHLTGILYIVQRDRITYAADKGERLLTAASPEITQLANVMDVTFTFLHTNTAPYNANSCKVKSKGDRFETYFKTKLVSVATDSAKVMQKFHFLLNSWVDRKDDSGNKVNIMSIYCLAHKLQLSSRNSIVPLKSDADQGTSLYYFSYLEKFMQSSYVWFKWSGKRIGMFRDVIDEEDLPKVAFKELHAERWISSEYRTVKNFATAWKTARIALDRMMKENINDKRVLEDVKSYDSQFKDKTALITIHFYGISQHPLKPGQNIYKKWLAF
ncbi:unnamed protein product [Orchesella dallaii]|uniref:Uncharacterized protein n=1 Tax=Orchesella dallaii TaxID=48710 RepID=A0ABP1R924_9HEXA